MRGSVAIFAAGAALACATPALADSADFDSAANLQTSDQARELPPYLQCVPYARQRSGIQIYGDALTWWDQAEGRYRRGNVPKVGAVMAFEPHGNMRLGHVAEVSRVIDRRTVLLDHANWSPIDGRRGQIERGVKAVDVSPDNDWSQVRVWYDPLQDLGTTAWPVAGFIYNQPVDGSAPARPALAAPTKLAQAEPVSATPSRKFLKAFAGFERSDPQPPRARHARSEERLAANDPIAAAVSRYDR
jgi:surface antigen